MQMRRCVVAVLVAAVLVAVLTPAEPAAAASITAQPVKRDLEFPAGFTVAPSGKIFYGERFSGEIRILDPKTGSDRLFFTIPDAVGSTAAAGPIGTQHFPGGEQGLIGLALHPTYPNPPYVYAFATREVRPDVHENHIVRIRNRGGTGSDMKVIFRMGARSTSHNGGRILFGPDGMLYSMIGDYDRPADAQNLSSKHGKMLRMTATGAVPGDNPFAGSYVYSYGHRNSIGFDFDPLSGRVWQTENGQECKDELNRIDPAQNYGWGPSWTCSTPPEPPANTNQDGRNPVQPQRWYTPPTAPVGATFCTACDLGPESEGALFFAEFNTGTIRRVILDPTRTTVAAEGESVVYDHHGDIISMESGPDGTIYFSTTKSIWRLVATAP